MRPLRVNRDCPKTIMRALLAFSLVEVSFVLGIVFLPCCWGVVLDRLIILGMPAFEDGYISRAMCFRLWALSSELACRRLDDGWLSWM